MLEHLHIAYLFAAFGIVLQEYWFMILLFGIVAYGLLDLEFDWLLLIFFFVVNLISFKLSSFEAPVGFFRSIALSFYFASYIAVIRLLVLMPTHLMRLFEYLFNILVKVAEQALIFLFEKITDFIKILFIGLINIIKIFFTFIYESISGIFTNSGNKSSKSSTVIVNKGGVTTPPPKTFGNPNRSYGSNSSSSATTHNKPSYNLYNSKGDLVKLDKDSFTEGGEAKLYKTSNNKVAKVFHDGQATLDKEQKLSKLVHMNLPSNVLKPIELLYDQDRIFVGYLMDMANGYELGELFLPDGLKNTFPNYTLIELIDLSISIIETYMKIHDESIIVGDINYRNIFVESKDKIYILDIDSFQLGKPSDAGIDTYTRTKLIGKDYNSYLRNIFDDSYAISMIVFQVLHYGYIPYGSDEEDVLKQGICLFDPRNTSHPEVLQDFYDCYNDLSDSLKEYFYDYFALKKYVPLDQLLKELQIYQDELLIALNK